MFRPAFLALLASAALAQQTIPSDEAKLQSTAYWPRYQTVLRVESKLVEVGVVVRDDRGHPVGGLTKEDFEIEDSGKKRDIVAFTREVSNPAPSPSGSAAPVPHESAPAAGTAAKTSKRFIGIFFDDFSMSANEMAQSRIAAKRFLKEALDHGEQVAIFSMSRPLVQPFTTDPAQLNTAIDRLNYGQRVPEGADSCPTFTPYEAYLVANDDLTELGVKTEEYLDCASPRSRRNRPPILRGDPGSGAGKVVSERARVIWDQIRYTSRATLLAVGAFVEYMAKMPGTRILVVESSGFLSGTLELEKDEIADRARRAQVVINSLDARGLYTDEARDVSQPVPKTFRAMTAAQSVGPTAKLAADDVLYALAAGTGGLFFHSNNDLNLGFQELGLAPEYSYSIAFEPAASADDRYHPIKVNLKPGDGRTLQYRRGYYAPAEHPAGTAERRIDGEVLGSGVLDEVPGTFTASQAKTDDGQPGLLLVLHLDLRKMRFRMQKGIRHQKVTWIVAMFDEGVYAGGRESSVEFALKDATFRALMHGFEAELTLPAPYGRHRLRSVIQEAVEGKVSATDQVVDVRPDR